MNIEIIFIESYPVLEKLTKDIKIFISIKNQKYNLKNIIESKKVFFLKNIQEQLQLKLLTKDNYILGMGIFNPLKFKELFSINLKPIFHWIDFKKEKNSLTNTNTSNFFLYEYIRLKIKITPIEIPNLNNTINTDIIYEESINDDLIISKKNMKPNLKSKYNKSFSNKSKDTTSMNFVDIKKNKLNFKKKYKISLNYYPGKIITKRNNNLNNNNSSINKNYSNQTTKINNSISFRLNNNSFKTQNLSRYNYYKNIKILKKSDTNVYEIDFNKKIDDNGKKFKKNKLSLLGEQLLLNETDEVLNKNTGNNTVNLEETFLSLTEKSDDNKEIEYLNSLNLLKNEIIREEIKKSIKNINNNMNNINQYDNNNINNLPKKPNNTKDIPNLMNFIHTECFNDSFEEESIKYEDEINKFNNLKNDFELFYTQKFFNYIKNDVIYFEFNLFLKKSLSLFNVYNCAFSKIFLENQALNHFLKYYRIQIKLLKKKINKLKTIKEDNEFKLENLEYLKESKNSIIKDIKKKHFLQIEILKNFYDIYSNNENSLQNLIQNLIVSKCNLIKNEKQRNILNNKKKILDEGILNDNIKYNTIDINGQELNNTLSNKKCNYKILNKDDLNKSMKSKKMIKTLDKEQELTKIYKKNSFKNSTFYDYNINNKTFQTKKIKIKKSKINGQNYSENFFKSKSKMIFNKTDNNSNILWKKTQNKK